MLVELAETGITSTIEALNKRKVFLGRIKDEKFDYLSSKFENDAEVKRINNVVDLDFMMTTFPQDLDFSGIEGTDKELNDWDVIDAELVTGSDNIGNLDYISFSGNNPVFEKTYKQFDEMRSDMADHPLILKDLTESLNLLRDFRDIAIASGIKILIHSVNNMAYVIVYDRAKIAKFREDLEIYLKGKHSPFGVTIGIINLNKSVVDRKNGVIDTNFVEGNLNSTFDYIDQRLKVSPPMKAIVDDVYRKKIIGEELLDEYGYVLTESGSKYLPNVIDFVYIPGAINSLISSLKKLLETNNSIRESDTVPQAIMNFIDGKNRSTFNGNTTNERMEAELDSNDAVDLMVINVSTALARRNIVYTERGVRNFILGWMDIWINVREHSKLDAYAMSALLVDIGLEGYHYNRETSSGDTEPSWVSRYVKRRDLSFNMSANNELELSKFLAGLLRTVKGLENSNHTDASSRSVIEDYVTSFKGMDAVNIAGKHLHKNKKFKMVSEVIETAFNLYGMAKDEGKEENKKSDLMSTVLDAGK